MGFIEKLKIRIFSVLASCVIRTLGSTLRWEVHGLGSYDERKAAGRPVIGAFWHGRSLASSLFFRNHGFVVMISRHRDGDYAASVLRRLGIGSARGSSTRGSMGAMAELLRHLRGCGNVAFTMDGPRGPRYVAKPGAAWLSSKSGCPIFPFNISAEKKWILSSWDHFQIPRPFSRVLFLAGDLIAVQPDAGEEDLKAAQGKLQRALDELRARGDAYWSG